MTPDDPSRNDIGELRDRLVATRREGIEKDFAIYSLKNRLTTESLLSGETFSRLQNLQAEAHKRTRELEKVNQDLNNAQEKLMRTEKLAAIGQLAASVSHELRNPLGAIRNAIYYIRESLKGAQILKKDPELEEFILLADKEVSRANQIIGDLLDFSRSIKLLRGLTNIAVVLRETLKSLEIPSNVKIQVDAAPDLPQVLVDPGRMVQVFANLILNAVQAMPEGGELRITAEADNPEGRAQLSIKFKDSGTGIPPEIKNKIFEPLFTTKAKGTGLGLPICASIIQAHNGTIAVESEDGKGAAFTIRLPLA